MLSCGGAPFSVTFSIVFDRSFSGSRFRSVVFDEDNTASAAAAAAAEAEAAGSRGWRQEAERVLGISIC